MSDLGLLSSARHLEVFAEAGHRLAALSPDQLDLPVPTVEGWTVQDVVRHTGRVHRRVAAYLAAPLDADPGAVARSADALSPGPACLSEYAEAHGTLLGALAVLDLDAPVATFLGPRPGAFWVRRQAMPEHPIRERLDDLLARKEQARTPGSERSIQRQHDRGKMLARERIDVPARRGQFHELDMLARHRSPDSRSGPTPTV
jgi:hypothetical protein